MPLFGFAIGLQLRIDKGNGGMCPCSVYQSHITLNALLTLLFALCRQWIASHDRDVTKKYELFSCCF